jgi:hypothetical protein
MDFRLMLSRDYLDLIGSQSDGLRLTARGCEITSTLNCRRSDGGRQTGFSWQNLRKQGTLPPGAPLR